MSTPRTLPVYKPRLPATWWLREWKSFLFMMREFTSFFIAIFVLTYLLGIHRFVEGKNRYEAFIDALQSPGWRILYFFIFVFALYHSITWFYSVPKILVVRLGPRAVPARLLLIGHYCAWVLISAVLFYLFTRT